MRRLIRRSDLTVVACPTCGLAFLDPMPDDATLAAIYGAHYYESWDLEHNLEATRRIKRATFARLLASVRQWLPPGAPVLDLGCATGFFLEEAAEAGFQPFGVDVAQYAIDQCERRFGPGRFYCGQFEQASFAANPGGKFGAIFMSDYIEHVRNPRGVLAHAAQSLLSGGVLVITTPNVQHISRILLGSHWPHFKREHLWYFSPGSLGRLLNETGSKVVAVHGVHKQLSVSYLTTQFRQYPMPVVTQLFNGLNAVLPNGLRNAIVPIPTGELTVVARMI